MNAPNSNTSTEPAALSALEISDLHHVAVACSDAEVSSRFYTTVLGFQPLSRPPFDFPGAWLFAGNMQIHLIQTSADLPLATTTIDSRTYHLAFRVPCLDQAIKTLESQGIDYVQRVNAGGIRQVFIQDPNGLNIELTVTTDPQYGYQADNA